MGLLKPSSFKESLLIDQIFLRRHLFYGIHWYTITTINLSNRATEKLSNENRYDYLGSPVRSIKSSNQATNQISRPEGKLFEQPPHVRPQRVVAPHKTWLLCCGNTGVGVARHWWHGLIMQKMTGIIIFEKFATNSTNEKWEWFNIE